MKITDLQPKGTFRYFSDIAAIPHGSGNTAEIQSYCVNFAKAHGLRYIHDDAGNVIIFADGTSGYENSSAVILQGHLDMVCDKTPDSAVDMSKEGLKLLTDGEYVYADKTSLGGDDGIAVAYILEILASEDIAHPPIEAVFTVDEETGMYGASGLDVSELRGKMLINIDSEDEGVITVSCAGGARADCSFPVEWENTDKGAVSYKLTIGGLKGGHSGIDIDKHRSNAIKLMGVILDKIYSRCSFNISSLSGGGVDNIITKSAEALLCVKSDDAESFEAVADKAVSAVISELEQTEPELFILIEKTDAPEKMLSDKCTKDTVFILMHIPNGVQNRSVKVSGAVRSSLNIGTMELNESRFMLGYLVRGNDDAGKNRILDQLASMTRFFGGKMDILSEYPAWEDRGDSYLQNVMKETYEEMYGCSPKVESIHAGLECGVIGAKLEGMDMVSIGPDIENVHSYNERMNIASVQRTREYLLKVLEKLK